jgi:hypothetical protein
VLRFPQVLVGPQEARGVRRHIIEPFVFTKAPVRTVVHDVEPYGSGEATEEHTFCHGPGYWWHEKNKVNINTDKARNKDQCFDV